MWVQQGVKKRRGVKRKPLNFQGLSFFHLLEVEQPLGLHSVRIAQACDVDPR